MLMMFCHKMKAVIFKKTNKQKKDPNAHYLAVTPLIMFQVSQKYASKVLAQS